MRNTLMLMVTLTVLVSGGASGATGVLTGNVVQVLTDDDNFGQCMARVSPSPATVLGACGAEWLTFDCSTDFGGSKTEASRKLDAANLALVTGNTIRFYITDSLTHNGFCFAERVDIFNS